MVISGSIFGLTLPLPTKTEISVVPAQLVYSILKCIRVSSYIMQINNILYNNSSKLENWGYMNKEA